MPTPTTAAAGIRATCCSADTTTGALGAYSFAGLAPGDYIVVVTAANFGNGAALDDLLIVQGVAADPDNNVDNDNNGVAATGGAVASQTITLAYNSRARRPGDAATTPTTRSISASSPTSRRSRMTTASPSTRIRARTT